MHENMSPLYRTLYEARGTGKIAGERYGYSSQFGGAAQRYIDKATAEARARGEKITGYRPLNYRRHRSDRTYTINVPIYGLDPKRAAEDLRKEQARLAQIQQSTYEKQQADIAKQLQIVQGEKSAVAKMQQDYSNMLIAEAQRRKEAEEQKRIDDELKAQAEQKHQEEITKKQQESDKQKEEITEFENKLKNANLEIEQERKKMEDQLAGAEREIREIQERAKKEVEMYESIKSQTK